MTPELLKLLTDLPFTALLTIAVYKLYIDGKSERALMLSKLDQALSEYDKMKDRITRIEWHLGIDDPPTLPLKPQTPLSP